MKLIVVGAGLCGRLLAWRLALAGYTVTLVDRDDGCGGQSAGYVAAAMLAPLTEAIGCGNALLAQSVVARDLWRDWIPELSRQTGQDIAFYESGSLLVAHRQDRSLLRDAERRLASLPHSWQGHGRMIDRDGLYRLEAELKGFEAALYFPCEGCIDNRALYLALAQALSDLAVDWYPGCTVESIEGRQLLAQSQDTQLLLDADFIFDCRGVGAAACDDRLRGVRGEVLRVFAPEVNLSRPVRLMHPRYTLYVAPRPDHHYVIGATEIESDSMAPVTVRSSLELQSALYTLHSGFAEAHVIEASAHCRPAYPDNLPWIRTAIDRLSLNGLYRHGYLLGPALVAKSLSLFQQGFTPDQYLPLCLKGESSSAAVHSELMPTI